MHEKKLQHLEKLHNTIIYHPVLELKEQLFLDRLHPWE